MLKSATKDLLAKVGISRITFQLHSLRASLRFLCEGHRGILPKTSDSFLEQQIVVGLRESQQ
jgi:hypothetical protein